MPLATHAVGFARDVATHVCFLDNGSVLERGSAEQILWSPREERTQQLLSRVGQVRAPVTRHLSVPSWHVT
jgi:polar amino acid transport system ATP-binding protein